MVGWVALSLGLVFGAPPPAEVQRAAKEVLADKRIQSEFPGARPGGPRQGTARPPRDRPRDVDLDLDAPRRDGGVLQFFMYLVMAVVIALAVIYFASRMKGYAPDLAAGPLQDASAPGEPAVALISDAESLADEGRYDLAVHTLLLLALEALGERTVLGDSLTSREVIRKVDLPDGTEEPIRALVGAVELSLFGGRDTGKAEYEEAAAQFRRFEQAFPQRAA